MPESFGSVLVRRWSEKIFLGSHGWARKEVKRKGGVRKGNKKGYSFLGNSKTLLEKEIKSEDIKTLCG